MKIKPVLTSSIIALLCGIVMIESCKNNSNNTVTPTVSFGTDIQPIFAASCALNGSCHLGSNNTNGHIDLSASTAYSTIVTKGLVSTSSPTSSMLYYEINSGVMPKAPYGKLSDAQITKVLNWIQQGALNN